MAVTMDKFWSFRKIVAIEEPVFNNTLERFYNLGVEGLVRENIQNSLDGKLPGVEGPVYVDINTGTMDVEEIPGIVELKEHIKCLKGENEYTKETIDHMKDNLDKTQIQYISFEDRNTKGLTGAEHGEIVQPGDTWGVYAYKKGVHYVEDDAIIEGSRGGSHGIGKIACNAASDIHLMFFANCDEKNRQHIGGTIQLIEHSMNGANYRSTGYLTKVIDDVYYPFENDFAPVFQKNTRGLKIIIPYLREQFQGVEPVIRAVCDNFWLAILEEKLVVRANDFIIDANKIKDIVKNPAIYEEQNYGDIKKNFTPLYIDTYLNYKPSIIQISDKKKDYPFKLWMMYNEQIKKGRVAVVRGIGMKIEDKKIPSYVNAPFNAILIPFSSMEDMFLKSLENESHTQLSYEHVKDPSVQANAKRFIRNIDKEMQNLIAELLRAANPVDGAIDTSDLIYSVERNFKKELSKELSTVHLTNGNKKDGKTIVKVKTKSRKNIKKNETKKEKNSVRDIIRKVLKKDGQDMEKDRVRYPMHPESVKRIVLNDKEILAFDFTEVEEYSGETICDISLSVIDGTGKAYESEFSVNTSYSKIYDHNAKKTCTVHKNIIQGVVIDEGKVNIEMFITDKFNSSLKFMYYVEV